MIYGLIAIVILQAAALLWTGWVLRSNTVLIKRQRAMITDMAEVIGRISGAAPGRPVVIQRPDGSVYVPVLGPGQSVEIPFSFPAVVREFQADGGNGHSARGADINPHPKKAGG